MLNWLKRLFSDQPSEPDLDDAEEEAWAKKKEEILESLLGPMHDMVMHAIIPYGIGGGLDLYYYPNHVEGVGIATQELTHAGPTGSSNTHYDAYELVMFTRHPLDLDQAKEESTPFGKAHSNINAVLNCVAPYSEQATLNPYETCEFPAEIDVVGGKCLIFDSYGEHEVNDKRFGLLLLIEVFRSEMDFAREEGGAALLSKLKSAGHYPYSDLDRDPVV